jgi:hypothetical protein
VHRNAPRTMAHRACAHVLDQGIGNKVIAPKGQQTRALVDDIESVFLDHRWHRLRATEIEKTVAVVDNRQFVERIERHAVRPLECQQRRRRANRARAEPCTGTIRRRRIQRYTGDDQIHALQVTGVSSAHERQRARVCRLTRRAVQAVSQKRVIAGLSFSGCRTVAGFLIGHRNITRSQSAARVRSRQCQAFSTSSSA